MVVSEFVGSGPREVPSSEFWLLVARGSTSGSDDWPISVVEPNRRVGEVSSVSGPWIWLPWMALVFLRSLVVEVELEEEVPLLLEAAELLSHCGRASCKGRASIPGFQLDCRLA